MGGASWQLAVCKTRCRNDVLLSSCALKLLLQQVLPLTRSFSWSLAASKGSEVSNNDIHALKSICGRLADKEAHSVVLQAVTVPSTLKQLPMKLSIENYLA